MSVFNLLMVASGICWTITYLLIIRRSIFDLTYGMPLAALCANFAWEFIFSVITPHTLPQLVVDRVWLIFDAIMVLQYLRFGARERQRRLSKSFYAEFMFNLAVAFALVWLVNKAFNDINGVYAAFGQNLMMSVLFINLLRTRKSANGQSIYIAVFKLVGTLLASVAVYTQTTTYGQNPLLQFLFVGILLYDSIYCIMLARQLQAQGIKIFSRL